LGYGFLVAGGVVAGFDFPPAAGAVAGAVPGAVVAGAVAAGVAGDNGIAGLAFVAGALFAGAVAAAGGWNV
jgi:hypothetical protein